MRTKKKTQILIIGYWPLLNPQDLGADPGQYFVDANSFYEHAFTHLEENCPSGHAEACVWSKTDEGHIAPVLVMPQAQAIADHLKTWAEGKPTEWFKLYIESNEDKYGIVLMPDADKSLKRHKLARLMFHDDAVGNENNYQLLSQPIAFSAQSDIFQTLQPGIPTDKVSLGLLDSNDIDKTNPAGVDMSKVIELGGFTRGDTSELGGYMKDLMANIIAA